MDEHKYEKTKNMLENRCVNTKEIRAAITHPDVREVHEALTELLETPIWKLLITIKQSIDQEDVPHHFEILSIEMDILLNTVKHPGSSDTVKTTAKANEVCSNIPEELKNYLFRYFLYENHAHYFSTMAYRGRHLHKISVDFGVESREKKQYYTFLHNHKTYYFLNLKKAFKFGRRMFNVVFFCVLIVTFRNLCVVWFYIKSMIS